MLGGSVKLGPGMVASEVDEEREGRGYIVRFTKAKGGMLWKGNAWKMVRESLR